VIVFGRATAIPPIYHIAPTRNSIRIQYPIRNCPAK
jgi:hypothetical protein